MRYLVYADKKEGNLFVGHDDVHLTGQNIRGNYSHLKDIDVVNV